MKARILKVVKWFLLIWGGFSFAAAIGLVVYVAFWIRLRVPTHEKIDSASPNDVRYVVNGCHFGEKQIEQVVHSYIGPRGFLNGGYVDAFAIKISNVNDVDFISRPEAPNEHWFRGDHLPETLDAAVTLVANWHDQFAWFPTGAELRSPDVYVYPTEFYGCCGSVEPTMATIIFVRKADNIMFYFNYKP